MIGIIDCLLGKMQLIIISTHHFELVSESIYLIIVTPEVVI